MTAEPSSSGDVARILRERAAELARPLTETLAHQPAEDVVVVEIAGERYGLTASAVVEIVTARKPTPVPGTPPHVLGVILRRGRLLTVIDLCPLFELTSPARGDATVIAVVASGERWFALCVDGVVGVDRAPAAAPDDLPDAPGPRRPFSRPLPGRSFAWLDTDALLHDPRVQVNQEASR